jgi:hypothetical protein
VNICPGWPQTSVLLISASQVGRITGVSPWRPQSQSFLKFVFVVLEWNPRPPFCQAIVAPPSHIPQLLICQPLGSPFLLVSPKK